MSFEMLVQKYDVFSFAMTLFRNLFKRKLSYIVFLRMKYRSANYIISLVFTFAAVSANAQSAENESETYFRSRFVFGVTIGHPAILQPVAAYYWTNFGLRGSAMVKGIDLDGMYVLSRGKSFLSEIGIAFLWAFPPEHTEESKIAFGPFWAFDAGGFFLKLGIEYTPIKSDPYTLGLFLPFITSVSSVPLGFFFQIGYLH
jgi:hypothetical protein